MSGAPPRLPAAKKGSTAPAAVSAAGAVLFAGAVKKPGAASFGAWRRKCAAKKAAAALSRCFGGVALGRDIDGGGGPAAVQHGLARQVDAKVEMEALGAGGQPVGGKGRVGGRV